MNVISVNTGYIAAGTLALGLLCGWYLTQKTLNAEHEAQLKTIEVQQEQAKDDLNSKIQNLERGLTQISTEAEVKYVTKQKELDESNTRYSALVDSGFRLRDSGEDQSSSDKTGSSVTSSSCVSHGSGTGKLSRDATERLWSLASRADRVAEKLAACQAYVSELTGYMNTQVSNYNKSISSK